MKYLDDARKIVGALGVWVLLALVVLAGVVTGLLSLLTLKTQYIQRVFRATDRAAAAVLGFSGADTVSKECGRSTCRFCRVLCAVLSVVLEPDHCQKEAA